MGPEGPDLASARTDLWTTATKVATVGACKKALGLRRDKRFGDWLEEYRPYFENYTVDASILETEETLFHIK